MSKKLLILLFFLLFLFGCESSVEKTGDAIRSQKKIPAYDASRCTDTDYGINASLLGTVFFGTEKITDSCIDKRTLLEQYCSRGKPSSVSLLCDNGCSFGVCVAEKQQQQPPQQQSQQLPKKTEEKLLSYTFSPLQKNENGDGMFNISSGSRIIASNGVEIEFVKILYSYETFHFLLFMNVYINNEKINLFPLLYESISMPYETFFYGVSVKIMTSGSSTTLFAEKIIKEGNGLPVLITATKTDASCQSFYAACMQKMDAFSCAVVCPTVALGKRLKWSNDQYTILYPEELLQKKDLVVQALDTCVEKLKSFYQLQTIPPVVVQLFSEQECPDCTATITGTSGIAWKITADYQPVCGELLAHELAHYLFTPNVLKPTILEEGRAVFPTQKLHLAVKNVTCTPSTWKKDKGEHQKISGYTVCLENTLSTCGAKKVTWQLSDDSLQDKKPMMILLNAGSFVLLNYSRDNTTALFKKQATEDTFIVNLTQPYLLEGSLISVGKIVTGMGKHILHISFWENMDASCVAGKQDVCMKEASQESYPFVSLDAGYVSGSYETGHCFWNELYETIGEKQFLTLHASMREAITSHTAFCLDKELLKSMKPETLTALLNKYDVGAYGLCSFSGVSPFFLGCKLNLC